MTNQPSLALIIGTILFVLGTWGGWSVGKALFLSI